MKIALAGNPNSGKTTLFNALTGSTARVGNWPGVTVDKKTGVYKKKGKRAEIVDLPGIYSLSPYTPEEIVARDYLLDGDADVVVNIVDATNLERNLYLTTQILETELPVVIALNMIDVVRKNGDKIDVDKLSDRMGVPVVPISALRGEGIDALIAACGTAALRPRKGQSVFAGTDLGNTIDALTRDFAECKVKSPLFHAVKLIENDPDAMLDEILSSLSRPASGEDVRRIEKLERLIQRGYAYGINVVVGTTDFASLRERLYDLVPNMQSRIVFSLSEDDAERIVHGALGQMETLRPNMAIITDGRSEPEIFKPYRISTI